MQNDERFHRGPSPVPPPSSRQRIRKLIDEMRERLTQSEEDAA